MRYLQPVSRYNHCNLSILLLCNLLRSSSPLRPKVILVILLAGKSVLFHCWHPEWYLSLHLNVKSLLNLQSIWSLVCSSRKKTGFYLIAPCKPMLKWKLKRIDWLVGYDRASTRGSVFMPVIAKPFCLNNIKCKWCDSLLSLIVIMIFGR